MESPRMYDTPMNQTDIKKMASHSSNNTAVNTNSSTNNNSVSAINHNALIVNKQQGQSHLQQANNSNNNNNNNNSNNNVLLQKQILQHYTQSDLEELTSQEISLDLQHLIDDQFREQETLGIFSDLVPNASNNNNNSNNNNHSNNGTVATAAKVLQIQQNRMGQQQSYSRNTLAYMPQAVHTGATYTNNSSDENSSVGSDATNIKEEPIEPQEYRRLAAAATVAANGTQFIGAGANQSVATAAGSSLYQLPPNYASNGSGNTFTTLTAPALHHQGLPHLPGNHLVSLKHKQIMSQRKQSNKHVDKGTDEYRRRRERNNIAVRKSREKAKVRSREVEEKVKALIKEKDALMRRLEEMTNEIQLHKQLYVHLMNHNNPEVNNICRNVLSLVSNDHGM